MKFVDIPQDGRSKYPALLEDIREATTQDNADKWVLLETFDKPTTARDTASRLKRENPSFEFTSRGTGEVFARYKLPKQRTRGT